MQERKQIVNQLTNRIIASIIDRKTKCKFTYSCNLYSNASYTCTHVGGRYCGKYRTLAKKTKNGMTEEVTDLTEEPILQ